MRLTAAVYEALKPILNEMSQSIENINNRLSESMRSSGAERGLSCINSTANMICDKNEYTCGATGGWRCAVYLDMTDLHTDCPSGWNMTGYSKRTCGRATNGLWTCDSAFFPVTGGPYSEVCGRIRAYQKGYPDAFSGYNNIYAGQTTIDSAYVSGVAVMHSSPRQHIWTFANGPWENRGTQHDNLCPCDTSGDISIPPFVGEDYFCESGYVYPGYFNTPSILRSDDVLWDGQDCHSTSSCCSLHSPPYFTKTLNQTTTDDLELRVCLHDPIVFDNIAVELVELYVK